MTFVQADPIVHLGSSSDEYDAAVICHCTWYFSSPSYLERLLVALSGRVKRICIAEWALTASNAFGIPHLIAALTQASLECRKPDSTSNIRTVLSPAAIHQLALSAGLTQVTERTFVPHDGLLDGSWEVATVLDDKFAMETDEYVKDEREKSVVLALRDSVRANADAIKGRQNRLESMDVWTAEYVRL